MVGNRCKCTSEGLGYDLKIGNKYSKPRCSTAISTEYINVKPFSGPAMARYLCEWKYLERNKNKQNQSSPFLVERRLLSLVLIKQLVLLKVALFLKSCQCIFTGFFLSYFFLSSYIVSSAQWCSIRCRKSEDFNVKLKAQSRL